MGANLNILGGSKPKQLANCVPTGSSGSGTGRAPTTKPQAQAKRHILAEKSLVRHKDTTIFPRRSFARLLKEILRDAAQASTVWKIENRALRCLMAASERLISDISERASQIAHRRGRTTVSLLDWQDAAQSLCPEHMDAVNAQHQRAAKRQRHSPVREKASAEP